MTITFEFPVVSFPDPDDLEDADISYYNASIKPIRLDREPYEATLEARGYGFHLIFGSQVNGNFLCIPNWRFACELAEFTNKDWNLHEILSEDSQLDYEDATAITWGLSVLSKHLHD